MMTNLLRNACLALIPAGLVLTPLALHAADPSTALQEDFSSGKVPGGWRVAHGDFRVEEGALVLAEKPEDKHNGVLVIPRPNQNLGVSFDFRLDGAKALALSFDVKPGTPGRKGHLFRVVLRPDGFAILRDPDKGNPEIKRAMLAEVKTAFEAGKWYTLNVEHVGSEVIARVGEGHVAKASDPLLGLPKPGLRFVITGQSARIDNLKVRDILASTGR